jgi:hypothetical protein
MIRKKLSYYNLKRINWKEEKIILITLNKWEK